MPRRIIPVLALCFLLLLSVAQRAMADDPYAGDFSGTKLSMEIVANGGSYSGTIHLGEQVLPFKGQVSDGQLTGTFTSNGQDYPFTANLAGDALTFSSGGGTYQLNRVAANPLGAGAPAPDANQGSSNDPPGYAVAAATNAGKAWVTKKPGITTVAAALGATISDLSKFFGNSLVVKGAFEDTRDHQSGAATFTANFSGHPIVGLITCRLDQNEAKISVTCCLATATAADWAKLNGAAKPSAPAVKLNRLDFPDGTGSVGVADNWTLKSGSAVDPLYVTGPDGQSMGYPGLWWITVVKPDSPRILQAQEQRSQLEDSFRRMGRVPPPPLNLFPVVAPFGPPDQMLPVVTPQWNAFKASRNLEVDTLDRITSVKPLPSAQPGMITQLLEYDMTKPVNGVATPFHSRTAWTSTPPGQYMTDQWALNPQGGMNAPAATFDKDLIIMQAMARSEKVNWDVYFKVDEERFKARLRANQIAFNERLKDQERQNVERAKEFAEHQQQVADEELQKSRNADDWIEYAGGYRKVIDTQTGEGGQVDLNDANNIVNFLNHDDPNRFQQIPLRDINHPANQ